MKNKIYLYIFSLYEIYVVGLCIYALVISKGNIDFYQIFNMLFLIVCGAILIWNGKNYKRIYDAVSEHLYDMNFVMRLFCIVELVPLSLLNYYFIVNGPDSTFIYIGNIFICMMFYYSLHDGFKVRI